MRYAVLVTYAATGAQAYVREGYRIGEGPIARFNQREAEDTKMMVAQGLDPGDLVTIVPWKDVVDDQNPRRITQRPRS